ncbi:MAG: hypothetical protein E7257_10280 [Lachnospiraceae bacterium]|nr:hypothetical protein [Lachnospiraceae bacterium]
MERWEMVNNFNNLVSKRTYYREKQSTIAALRECVNTQMDLCIGYCDEIALHLGQANYFDMLHEKNSERYSVTERDGMLGELDSISSYIASTLQGIQSEINYYDRLIKEYDAEHQQ